MSPIQLVRRVSKNGSSTQCGSIHASAASSATPANASGARARRAGGRRVPSRRSTISITAMPCSTPKLIQLLGNMIREPNDTSSAQPATCAQRRQNRAQVWPASTATAWPAPAPSRNIETMHRRCVVQNGSP